jgi:hypothetical protein
MSDADDQLGGTGGEHGPKPEDRDGQRAGRAKPPCDRSKESREMEESEDSFPASDPPGNY